ncbi:hypothetical protein B0H14DRAFT_2905007, partial [Mycena olivaceomarginata]
MLTSCTFSVSSPLLPPLGDRQGTASCLPKASTTLACTSSSNTVTRCCATCRRGHERAAGVFVERDGVPGGVCMRRVRVSGVPFTSLDSLPSFLHPSRTLVSTSAGANTSACIPAPSMSGLMCALLGHNHARTWTKRGPCSIDSKEWITVSTPRITRLLVIITRCRFIYCLRTVVLIFCKEKAEYAPYYRHSLIFRWIVLGADCFALQNTHAPRVCEGIGRCVDPLRAS